VSPSGTGLKLLFLLDSPPGAKSKNQEGTVEFYTKGRYFTLTGERLKETSPEVEYRDAEATAVYRDHIGSEEPKSKSVSVSTKTGLSLPALMAMLEIVPAPNEFDGSK